VSGLAGGKAASSTGADVIVGGSGLMSGVVGGDLFKFSVTVTGGRVASNTEAGIEVEGLCFLGGMVGADVDDSFSAVGPAPGAETGISCDSSGFAASKRSYIMEVGCTRPETG